MSKSPVSTKVYEAYRIREGVDPFPVLWKIQEIARNNITQKLSDLFKNIQNGSSQALKQKEQDRGKHFEGWLREKYPERAGLEGSALFEGLSMYKEVTEWDKSCPLELQHRDDDNGYVYPVSNDEIFEKAGRENKVGSGETPSLFAISDWGRKMFGDQLTRYEHNPWAIEVSVTVRELEGRLYLIPYCERSSIVGGALKFMKEMDELEDYAYWDNVDPPEEVPSKKWRARGKVWYHFTDGDRWREYLTLEILTWNTWLDVCPME